MEHESPVDHTEDPEPKRRKEEADFSEFLNDDDEAELVSATEKAEASSSDDVSFKFTVNLALLHRLFSIIATCGKQLDISVHLDGSVELKCTKKSRASMGHITLYDVQVDTPGNKSFSVTSSVFMDILNAMNVFNCDTVSVSLVNCKLMIALTDGSYSNEMTYAESVDDMDIDCSTIICSTEWPKDKIANIFTKTMVGDTTTIVISDGKVNFTSTSDDQSPSVVMPIETTASYDESVENSAVSIVSKFKMNNVHLRLSPRFFQFHSEVGGDPRSYVRYTVATQAKKVGGYF